MRGYAIFDTETNGLFDFSRPAHAEGQPRLAHLAVILLNAELEEERAIDFYVQPDGWVMEGEAAQVNGLTTEFLRDNGAPILDVLDQYVRIIDAGYVLVAYNAQYDTKVMRGELRRAGLDDRFEATPNLCAMRSSMKLGVKKASGRGGFPKLSDVCAHLGIDHEKAHTAGGDARVCCEIFRHLYRHDLLPQARVHYAKNRPVDDGSPARAPAPAATPTATPATAIPEAF